MAPLESLSEVKRPRKLFKYRSMNSHGNDCLLGSSEIYFSRPSELNDPFECKPVLTADLDPAAIREYQDYLKEKHAPGAGFVRWQKVRRQAALRLSKSQVRQQLHDDIVERSGFFCLSAVNDNLLMWAHYSDNHRGFCLEFDTEEGDKNYFADAWPVEYSEERPSVSVTRKPDQEQLLAVLNSTYLAKGKDWSYEKEFRKISFDNPGIQQFPPEALTGVILGCRMTDQDRDKLCELVLSRKHPPALYRATMDETMYQLTIETIAGDTA